MKLQSFALVAFAASASAQQLAAVLANQSTLSNLTSLIALFPNLVDEIASVSAITLLAPNDAAFAKSGKNSSAEMALAKNDTSMASTILSYHILKGSYGNFSSKPQFPPSLLSSSVYTNVTGGQVVEALQSSVYSGLLQESKIVKGPITFSGGVVYIIDTILTYPQNITSTILDVNLTAAAGALEKSGMNTTIDDMADLTLFVPSNDAFQAVNAALANVSMQELAVILDYHVVSGTIGYSSMLTNMSLPSLQGGNVTITVEANGDIFVNSAKVVIPDILVANGVVHVIDGVLNPANPTAKPNPTASTQALVFPVPTTSTMSSATAAGTMKSTAGKSQTGTVPFTSGVTPASTTVQTSGVKSTAAAAPMKTGNMAMAALLGGAAVMINV